MCLTKLRQNSAAFFRVLWETETVFQNSAEPRLTITTKTLSNLALRPPPKHYILKHYIHNTLPFWNTTFITHHQNTTFTTTKTLSNLALRPPPKHFQTSLYYHHQNTFKPRFSTISVFTVEYMKSLWSLKISQRSPSSNLRKNVEQCLANVKCNPLKTTKAVIPSPTISAITRQSVELEKCSNHLRIRQDV